MFVCVHNLKGAENSAPSWGRGKESANLECVLVISILQGSVSTYMCLLKVSWEFLAY